MCGLGWGERGEINEKTADIQARSSMARTLEINGKTRQAEGEAKVKVVWGKAPSRERTKIARDLFHWPWGQETGGDHQECSQELPLCLARSARIIRFVEMVIKTGVYSGNQWIYKTANGRLSTESSCTMLGNFVYLFVVLRYCELSNRTTQQLYKVSTPCIDDHHFTTEELKSEGELSKIMLSNCCEMLVRGTYWKTRYSMVTE